MRSTLWILLFIVFLVVCIYKADSTVVFNPPKLDAYTDARKQKLENYCVQKYPVFQMSHESCLSICNYNDNGIIKTMGNAQCKASSLITNIGNVETCLDLQEKLEFCIPECADFPGACNLKRMPGFKHTLEAVMPIFALDKYTYNKDDFSEPFWDEINEYRHELCTEAYKDKGEEELPTDSCYSFCRYKSHTDSSRVHVYGHNTLKKCSPTNDIVPIKNETFCSKWQYLLEKCIPECETCLYTNPISGFRFQRQSQDVKFPVPLEARYSSTSKIDIEAVQYSGVVIKAPEKARLCYEIYSNPAQTNAHCLSFCLYQSNMKVYSLTRINCTKALGLGLYDENKENDKKMCEYIESRLGECVDDCDSICGTETSTLPPIVEPTREPSTSSVATTTVRTTTTTADTSTKPVQTTKNPSPLASSSKSQGIPSTTAKVAATTRTTIPDIPRPIGPIPTYLPDPEEEETTLDPKSNQRATEPGPSATGDKKEEGGGPNLNLLWILLPIALFLLVGGGIAGFFVRRRLKARKSNGKSKTVDVEKGILPPPPSMPKKPSTRKRPYLKVTQVDETAPPREMPPGQITDKFKFEGALDLDATGTHGKTTHQLDGAKSHSLRDVVFSDEMNRVFDMGSRVERIVPSPPREGAAEGGQGGQPQGQDGAVQQGEQGQQGGQGGQGGEAARSQGGQAPAENK